MEIKSPNNSIIYSDTEEHFKNAFLRLMNMEQETFEKWLKLSEKESGSLLLKLAIVFYGIKPLDTTKHLKAKSDFGFLKFILNDDYYIIQSNDLSIAWLSKKINGCYVKETVPPAYEEDYFEGDPLVSGGYKNYADQSGWRIEKSKRQVKELSEITGLSTGYVLDVGSGYGYFRKALDDAGFKHEGIEISNHAAAVSKSIYGFDSNIGEVSNYVEKFNNTFDVIMLSDIIEHVPNPEEFLKEVFSMLKVGGFVIIKTPNIDCPEVAVFGKHYHSFKREHLTYFTPRSLTKIAETVGLIEFNISTTSHLLVGFIGENEAKQLESKLKGSDIVAYYKRP